MKENNRIFLYGNSLILGSIGDSLRRCPQFEVTTLLPPLKEMQDLNFLKPGILIFDLEMTRPENVFSLLESDPNLQLIGISPDINIVKVWSLRELREMTMENLLHMIRNLEKSPSVEPKEMKYGFTKNAEKAFTGNK